MTGVTSANTDGLAAVGRNVPTLEYAKRLSGCFSFGGYASLFRRNEIVVLGLECEFPENPEVGENRQGWANFTPRFG